MADPLDIPDIVGGATLGPDRTRQAYSSDARYWIVSATWAQRAVNAAHAAEGRPRIFVDGRAGRVTITALRALGAGLPAAENYPTSDRVTSRVLVSRTLATRLEALAPVADPTRPRPVAIDAAVATVVTPNAAVVVADEHTANPPWLTRILAAVSGAVLGGGVVWFVGRRR